MTNKNGNICHTFFSVSNGSYGERNSTVEELVKRENIEKGVGVEATHNDTHHITFINS